MLTRLIPIAAGLLAALAATGWTATATSAPAAWIAVALAGAVALRWPYAGLLIAAATGPLGGAIAALAAWRVPAAEPVAFAVLAGWCLRRALVVEPLDRLATAAAGLFAALVLASLLVQCVVVYRVAAPLDLRLTIALLEWLTMTSEVRGVPWRPEVASALRLLAGCGLFVMAAAVAAQDRSRVHGTARILVAAIAGVAALNVNRFVEVALRHGPDFWAAAAEAHQTLRISSTIPDVNAVAALFALALPVLVMLAATARRGARLWIAAAVLVVAGLWLTGSRAGMSGAAAAVVGYGVLQAVRAPKRDAILAALAVLVAIIAATALVYPRPEIHARASDAWNIRRELARVSLRMVTESPLSGVGVGRFRDESARLATPGLRRYYSQADAHNQFLQLAGELGLPGGAMFLALIGIAMLPPIAGWARGERDDAGLAVTAGLGGFLLASVLMHPLLLPEVSVAFWIALGLARASGQGTSIRWSRRHSVIAAAAVLMALASIVPRASAVRQDLDLDNRSVGLSAVRADRAGRRYQVARGDSILYVAQHDGRLRLSVRAHRRVRGTAGELRLLLDGGDAGTFGVNGERWTDLDLALPSDPKAPRFGRLDLIWTPRRPGNALRVARQPAEQ